MIIALTGLDDTKGAGGPVRQRRAQRRPRDDDGGWDVRRGDDGRRGGRRGHSTTAGGRRHRRLEVLYL